MQEGFAGRYGDLERWHWWFRGRERILARVLDRELGAEPAVPRRIATLGCGPPEGLAWLTRYAGPGGVVVGIDADPSGALRAAGLRCPDGVAYVIGRMEQPPVAPGSCDALIALDVLEHIEQDGTALAAAARMLRPGAPVIVTVPALPSLWGNQDVVSHHLRRYTRGTLTATCGRAGLEALRVQYFNSLLFPPVAAVRWGRRLLGRADEAQSDFDDGRPGLANDVLERIFSLERHWVGRVGGPVGVSLLAMARAPAPGASA